MGNNMVSPSTSGVRPRMQKMYDGRNTATRPIPLIVDQSEIRAINAAAADSSPKTAAVQFPTNQRPITSSAVFGSRVTGPGGVIDNRAATFSPITGTDNFE